MANPDAFTEAGHPDAAGWVLGILNPYESARFKVHLQSCAECQQTVTELHSVAQLLVALPQDVQLADGPQPPPDLQARTMARVRQAAAKSAGKAVRRWSPRRTLSAAAAAVAAAVAAIVFLLMPSAPALAFTIPLHAQVGLTASGQAVAHQTSNGWSITMTLRGMPKLGPGQFYECWYAGPGNRPGHPDLIAAGTFTAGSAGAATVQMWSAADPRRFPVMQITVETAGNAEQHGQVLLSGTAQK
jgi:Anti-sigma-K factor rskA, C-terminal